MLSSVPTFSTSFSLGGCEEDSDTVGADSASPDDVSSEPACGGTLVVWKCVIAVPVNSKQA